jgi:DNA mismatch endonuclease (patch repair protein)
MADVFTKEKRSWVMSRIKGTDTKPENLLAEKLRKSKIKFKKYPKLLGKPDFLVEKDTVVFVDGCFWHGCPKHYREPKTKKKFWLPKIMKNMQRDKEVARKLKKEGYIVVRFWEHEVEKNLDGCIRKLRKSRTVK